MLDRREQIERMAREAEEMRNLKTKTKETFTRDDGTQMVVITREHFLDLLEAIDEDWDLGEDEI